MYCTILTVERCSLGNTSLHMYKMTPPPLEEYFTLLYCIFGDQLIQYYSYIVLYGSASAASAIFYLGMEVGGGGANTLLHLLLP